MLIAAVVTFAGLWLLLTHISPRFMRRLVGYIGWFDLALHATIILMFMGTVSGLLQAEAAGIMLSLYLRAYRWAFGYERLRRTGWLRWPGRFTRLAA